MSVNAADEGAETPVLHEQSSQVAQVVTDFFVLLDIKLVEGRRRRKETDVGAGFLWAVPGMDAL